MTGKDILAQQFERAGMRGYRADEVDEFLQTVAAYVDEQEARYEDLTYKVKVLAEKVEEYKNDESNIRDALVNAQKLGASIMAESKNKAEGMLAEAQAKYNEAVQKAQNKADIMLREATKKAEYDLSEMKKETDRERLNYERIKKEVGGFKAFIIKQYKSHVDLLNRLPDYEPQMKQREEDPAETAPAVQAEERIAEPQKPVKVVEVEEAPTVGETAAETSELKFASRLNFSSADEPVREEEQDEEQISIQPKTITSDILTNEKELLKDEQEQTREFNSDDNAEKAKTNFGAPAHKRPNYLEKFGELQFGSNSSDE